MDNNQCKYKGIKDKENSSWSNTVYRQCKITHRLEDGYCPNHHPKQIEQSILVDCLRETIEAAREKQRIEEGIVGKMMRAKYPDDFNRILGEIESAREILKSLGG